MVLLVHPAGTQRDFVELQLKDAGYYVKAVDSLTEALKVLKSMQFDVVLTSAHIENGLGVELLAAVAKAFPNAKRWLMSINERPQDSNIQEFFSKKDRIQMVHMIIAELGKLKPGQA